MQFREKNTIIKNAEPFKWTGSSGQTNDFKSFALKLFSIVVYWIVPLSVCYVLFDSIFENELIDNLLSKLIASLGSSDIFFVVLSVFLIPFNWGIEAKKWQIVLNAVMEVEYGSAFKSVLVGLSLNTLIPMGVGDFIGRLFSSGKSDPNELVGGLIACRFSQLFFTLLFGLVSVVFLITKTDYSWSLALIMTTCLTIAILLIFQTKTKLTKSVHRFFGKKFVFLKSFQALSANQTLSLFLWSLFRYLVFSFQFYLIAKLLGISAPGWIVFLGIAWVFLFKSITPALSIFSDLAVRELSAVFFFGFFELDLVPISVATFAVWLLNIVIPAIAGVFFIRHVKIPAK